MITKIKKHGTITSYANGCRCDKCKKAISDYRKNLKPKNHGTKWSYDIGCRCDKCKQAKMNFYRKHHDVKDPITDIEHQTRLCGMCKIRKPLSDYGRNRSRLLGKEYLCKICKAKIGKINKNKPGQRYAVYKSSARVRNLEFDLTFEQFIKFWDKECCYCGEKINGIGLDRKDSKIGYNINNVLPCCSKCNRAKGTLAKSDFIALCKKVSKRF